MPNVAERLYFLLELYEMHVRIITVTFSVYLGNYFWKQWINQVDKLCEQRQAKIVRQKGELDFVCVCCLQK